jgi:hypothetical protein
LEISDKWIKALDKYEKTCCLSGVFRWREGLSIHEDRAFEAPPIAKILDSPNVLRN